jgi:hypothetical protein
MRRGRTNGWIPALLAIGPAWPVAADSYVGQESLPAISWPDQSKPCTIGEQVTVIGTIQDVAQKRRAWTAGTIARVDHCSGLTDPSTGFAALFGEGRAPSSCERGARFLAVGTARSGFEPQFFLNVQSITCE